MKTLAKKHNLEHVYHRIYNRLRGRGSRCDREAGGARLTVSQEKLVIAQILKMGSDGAVVRHRDIAAAAYQILLDDLPAGEQAPPPLSVQRPGRFLSRNPSVTKRKKVT